MLAYMRLFRADAALIAFVSYLIGAELAGDVNLKDLIVATCITGISVNFIYSFNAWADHQIDAINKPWRPIPSGQIAPKKALAYSLFLLVVAFIYPFFVAQSLLTFVLCQLLPVLGLLYSAKPLSFRRYAFPSALTVSLGLITPLMLGYFMHTSDEDLVPLFVSLFFFCICVVPLKDIEDAGGDRAYGIRNFYLSWGSKLLLFSLVGLAIDLVWISVASLPLILKIQAATIMMATIVCILIFHYGRLNMRVLYRTIIWTNITLAIGLYLVIR